MCAIELDGEYDISAKMMIGPLRKTYRVRTFFCWSSCTTSFRSHGLFKGVLFDGMDQESYCDSRQIFHNSKTEELIGCNKFQKTILNLKE
jgi:hypothetical protein